MSNILIIMDCSLSEIFFRESETFVPRNRISIRCKSGFCVKKCYKNVQMFFSYPNFAEKAELAFKHKWIRIQIDCSGFRCCRGCMQASCHVWWVEGIRVIHVSIISAMHSISDPSRTVLSYVFLSPANWNRKQNGNQISFCSHMIINQMGSRGGLFFMTFFISSRTNSLRYMDFYYVNDSSESRCFMNGNGGTLITNMLICFIYLSHQNQ